MTARPAAAPETEHEALRVDLLKRLAAHQPSDEREQASLLQTIRWVESAPAPFARSTREGHVTASAVVLDSAGRALLLLHRSLGRWLQPGGHLEPGEAPWAGAMREAREETGLVDLQPAVPIGSDRRVLQVEDADGPPILDVDVHPIPDAPAKGEPAHRHLDVCFLVRTATPELAMHSETESRALRWVTAEEAQALPLEPATRRRLAKAFAL